MNLKRKNLPELASTEYKAHQIIVHIYHKHGKICWDTHSWFQSYEVFMAIFLQYLAQQCLLSRVHNFRDRGNYELGTLSWSS